jgi:hypothetical protein
MTGFNSPNLRKQPRRGIPDLVSGLSFGGVDMRPDAPLHRRLGIRTYTHRQAILVSSNDRFGEPRRRADFDEVNRVFSDSHLYRVSVTLPKIGP